IMTPLEFLARLATIVPPPRFPLLRYAGVLAPASKWRREVVPRAPEAKPCSKGPADEEHEVRRESTSVAGGEPKRARNSSTRAAAATTRWTESPPDPLRPPATLLEAQPAAGWQLLTPNVLSVKHWERLLGGALYPATPRLGWAL